MPDGAGEIRIPIRESSRVEHSITIALQSDLGNVLVKGRIRPAIHVNDRHRDFTVTLFAGIRGRIKVLDRTERQPNSPGRNREA